MKVCTICGTSNLNTKEVCDKCGNNLQETLAGANYSSPHKTENGFPPRPSFEQSQPSSAYEYKPWLTSFFNGMSVISVIGGAIGTIAFWPKDNLVINYLFYIPPIACAVFGVLAAIVFFAFGKVVKDLELIKDKLNIK